jgi:hypothetical protein
LVTILFLIDLAAAYEVLAHGKYAVGRIWTIAPSPVKEIRAKQEKEKIREGPPDKALER